MCKCGTWNPACTCTPGTNTYMRTRVSNTDAEEFCALQLIFTKNRSRVLPMIMIMPAATADASIMDKHNAGFPQRGP